MTPSPPDEREAIVRKDLADSAEQQDKAELARLVAEWRALKKAFCDGFFGKPFRGDHLSEQGEG